jgi:Peptidase M15
MTLACRFAARLGLGLGLALLSAIASAQTSASPSPPPRPFDLGGKLAPGPAVTLPDKSKPQPDAPAETLPAPGGAQIVSTPTPPARPAFPSDTVAASGAAEPAPVSVPPVLPPVVRSAGGRPTAVAAAPPPENFVSRLGRWFTPSDAPSDDEEDEWPRRTRGQRASLNTEPLFDPNEKPERPGLSTDPGVSTKCLPDVLQTVLQKVIARFGAVKVTSTYRPAWRARRGSYHRRCEAVDFRVPGVRPGEVLSVVKDYEETGGHKVYWNGLIHVDTGPFRTWRGSRR